MKKKLAGMLAALMVLTMGTTVFAATSPTAEDISQAESAATSVTTDSGVTLSKSQITVTVYKEATEKAEAITADAEVLAAFELTAPADATFPMAVTISVSGIKKGDTVKVLHKCSQHGWETLTPSKTSNGSVTVNVHSLSPIAVVRTATEAQNNSGGSTEETQTVINNYYNYYTNPSVKTGNTTASSGNATASTGNATNSGITQSNNNNQVVNVYTTAPTAAATSGTSTSKTSPKTGTTVPVLSLIAIFAVTGIAVCTKKARSL